MRKILKKDVLFARPLPKGEEYVDYNGRPLNLLGLTTVDVKVGKKEIKKARVVITWDGKKSLIGRDWVTSLNFRVADTNMSEYNNSINTVNSNNNKIEKIERSPELKRIKQKFPKIFSRQGKIVGHTIQIEFKEGAKATQQKGRRVPLQLQKAVDEEESNKSRTHRTSRKNIRRNVYTTSGNNSQKGSKCQNRIGCQIFQQCHYERKIPNAESVQPNRRDRNRKWQTRRRSTIHITGHAICIRTNNTTSGNSKTLQLPNNWRRDHRHIRVQNRILWPDNNAARISEDYGQILHKKTKTFAFLDDILIVTKSSKENHLKEVEDTTKALDNAGIRLKLEKSNIAKTETEWLGFKLSGEGIKPIDEKVQAITEKLGPQNLKDLRSFMGAIIQMNKFIPKLANLCAPLRPLLKQDGEWLWKKRT